MSSKVWVWDPNPFNPYGLEVARVIAASGASVTHVTRRGSLLRSESVRSVALLPLPAAGQHTLRHKVEYALGLAAFAIAVSFARPTLVVPWVSSSIEARVMRFLQLLRVPTIVVVHNPIPARDDVGSSLIASIRRAATVVVVHSEVFRDAFDRPVLVVSHPAYFAWRDSMERSRGGHSPFSEGPSLAMYFGSIRADKGFEHLPAIDGLLHDRGMRLGICIGRASKWQKDVLEACLHSVIVGGTDEYVSDGDLYEGLISSDVMIAPYRDVTVSGSMILALSVGRPVASFPIRSMPELDEVNFTADTESLVELVDRAVAIARSSDSRSDARELSARMDEASVAGWSLAISEALHMVGARRK